MRVANREMVASRTVRHFAGADARRFGATRERRRKRSAMFVQHARSSNPPATRASHVRVYHLLTSSLQNPHHSE